MICPFFIMDTVNVIALNVSSLKHVLIFALVENSKQTSSQIVSFKHIPVHSVDTTNKPVCFTGTDATST